MLIPLLLPQDIANIIVLDGVSLDLEKGVSNLVYEQVPSFVAAEHGQFAEFLKQYYEWMEFETNPKYESNHLIEYRDVDLTTESLLKRFMNEFANGIPELLASADTDKRKMVKRLVDFYRAKGTERSFKTFFRLLFGEEPILYYPSEDILRLSSGVWKQPSVMKLSRTIPMSRVPDLVGRRVYQSGVTAGSITAYGFVERSEVQLRYGHEVLELELSGVFGDFISEKDIILTFSDGSTARETIIPVLGSIGISSGGRGYEVGDELQISGSSYGVGAKVYVSTVGPSGDVRAFEIEDSGVFYRTKDVLSTTILNDGSGVCGEFYALGGGSIVQTIGYWEGADGLLSSAHKIQDNDYYQSFSYVIRSGRNISDYKDAIKKMVHPAGFKQFGEFLLEESIGVEVEDSTSSDLIESPVIGHYTPYRFETIRNLRANGVGGSGGLDLYPGGYEWKMALGNTYYNEEDDVAPPSPVFILGSSGPLGGVTHVEESIGICGASEGPGGTLNAVQGSQYAVNGGASGFNGVSSGTTGGDWWEIYPHMNARAAKEIPFTFNKDVYRLQVSASESSAKGDPDPGFYNGEIVRQVTPNTQQATGKIVNRAIIAQKNYVDVVVYSGSFINTFTSTIGGSAGYLQGIGSGVTAYINNTDNQYGSETADMEFGAVEIKDALYAIGAPTLIIT